MFPLSLAFSSSNFLISFLLPYTNFFFAYISFLLLFSLGRVSRSSHYLSSYLFHYCHFLHLHLHLASPCICSITVISHFFVRFITLLFAFRIFLLCLLSLNLSLPVSSNSPSPKSHFLASRCFCRDFFKLSDSFFFSFFFLETFFKIFRFPFSRYSYRNVSTPRTGVDNNNNNNNRASRIKKLERRNCQVERSNSYEILLPLRRRFAIKQTSSDSLEKRKQCASINSLFIGELNRFLFDNEEEDQKSTIIQ